MLVGMRHLAVLFTFAILHALGSPTVHAQDGAPADVNVRARGHYDRGIGLFDEGQYTGALAEFEAAYTLTARPSLLFNIGQIHARLGHAVEATDALERYLTEARDVPAERRALVESEIATQRSRIGLVRVEAYALEAPVEGASVSLDDVSRGTLPLAEPLRVSAGEHVLGVTADGHEAARERFRIAGGEDRTLRVELARVATAVVPITPPIATPSSPAPTLTIVGAAIAGVGLVTWAATGLVTLLEADALTNGANACSPSCTPDRLATIDTTRIVADVGLGVLGVGAVLLVVGVVVELASPDAGRGDGARASVGPGGVEVTW
jgi:tetratricopeptide (TPR) repeat protein